MPQHISGNATENQAGKDGVRRFTDDHDVRLVLGGELRQSVANVLIL
jgi:hypothetical protein